MIGFRSRKRGDSAKGDVPGTWRTEKVRWMGRSYEIPVDAEGHVPMDAMVMRYQEMGNSSRDKSRSSSRIIYPRNATPMDIVQWWADPSSCDVDGIDTKNPRVYDVSGIKGREMRRVQSRIGVITPSQEEQRRIRTIIANAFTAEELEEMTRGPSFVIRTVADGGRAYGYYLMNGDGVKVPIITLEEGVSADSVIHETVHHARTTRPKGRTTSCAYPQKADGSFDMKTYLKLSEQEKLTLRDAEESATTAEATARSHTDPHPSGYWDKAGGHEAYLADRKTLSSHCKGKDCTLKGLPAIKVVEKEYDGLNIAKAIILSNKPAGESVKEVRNAQSEGGKKPLTAAVKEDAEKKTKGPQKRTNPNKSKSSPTKTRDSPTKSNKNPRGGPKK